MKTRATEKSTQKYIQDIRKYRQLTDNEELELLKKWQNEKDINARNELITSLLGYVVTIAKGYDGMGVSRSDIIQAGNMGLIAGIDKAHAEMGNALVSYLSQWVRYYIQKEIGYRTKASAVNCECVVPRVEDDGESIEVEFEGDIQNPEDEIISRESGIDDNVLMKLLNILDTDERDAIERAYRLGKYSGTKEPGNKKNNETYQRALRKLREHAVTLDCGIY